MQLNDIIMTEQQHYLVNNGNIFRLWVKKEVVVSDPVVLNLELSL